MRLLFTTLREKSHLLAMTPFVEGCLRRGHEVAIAAAAGLRRSRRRDGRSLSALRTSRRRGAAAVLGPLSRGAEGRVDAIGDRGGLRGRVCRCGHPRIARDAGALAAIRRPARVARVRGTGRGREGRHPARPRRDLRARSGGGHPVLRRALGRPPPRSVRSLARPGRRHEVCGALDRVLGSPSFRAAAQRMAQEIAGLPLVDDAAGAIERLAAGSG
jgi:hypothetical protein